LHDTISFLIRSPHGSFLSTSDMMPPVEGRRHFGRVVRWCSTQTKGPYLAVHAHSTLPILQVFLELPDPDSNQD
jgi:hypothetical protein